MEQWCTWKRVKVNDSRYKDPNTFEIPENITFTETGYSDGSNLFIGKIAGVESEITAFVDSHPEFLVDTKAETDVINLLNTWYSEYEIKDGETEMFTISNGEIVDNRFIEDTI